MKSEPLLLHSKCRGMRDMLPGDMSRFRRVEAAFLDACRTYGYEEVKPPTIEYLQLFTALGTLTPAMVGKVYSFLDWDGWSGERVVLRPDSTIPVARLYVENLAPRSPVRLCYVTNSFVFEETGRRNRERWQGGAEFIGGAPVVADVEMVLLASDVIARLGLKDVRFQVCHAGLLKSLIDELDLGAQEKEHLVESVLDGDWSGLEEAVAGVADRKRYLPPLLALKGVSSGYLRNVRALSTGAGPAFRAALDQFIEVASLLDELECGYQIDITAVRSFEYYTGICFQLVSGSAEKVGGGGRYDDLIPMMGGPNIPACGFALYIDQIMGLLDGREVGVPRAAVVCDDASTVAVQRTLEVARAVRAAGGIASVGIRRGPEFTGRYRWVVRVTSETAETVELTDSETREKVTCSIAEAVERLVS